MEQEKIYSGHSFQLNEIDLEFASCASVKSEQLHDPCRFISKHVNGGGEQEVLAILSSTFVYSECAVGRHARASVRQSDDKKIPTLLLCGRFGGSSHEARDYNKETILSESFKSTYGDFTSSFSIVEVFPKYIGKEIEDSHLEPTTLRALGVYHPKFHIIVMTHGIAISISSANMTAPCSLEGTWSQFFPRKRDDWTKSDTSDFAPYFSTFLELIDEQIGNQDKTIECFISKYLENSCLGVKTARELLDAFDFSGAEVELVATVPGRYYLSEEPSQIIRDLDGNRIIKGHCSCSDKLKSCRMWPNGFKFGYERLKSLLEKAEKANNGRGDRDPEWGDKAPEVEEILSNYLHIQPTSLGNHITADYLREELFIGTLTPKEREVLGQKHRYDDMEDVGETQRSDDDDFSIDAGILKAVRVVWPSERAVQQSLPRYMGQKKAVLSLPDGRRLSLLAFQAFEAMREGRESMHLYEPNFSKGVDSVDELLARRDEGQPRTWDAAVANANHFKSQLKESSVAPLNEKCTCASLQWCLLSSTCLSRGANGSRAPSFEEGMHCTDSRCANNPKAHLKAPAEPSAQYFECKNFELGVLFRSTSTRRYLAMDARCSVHGCSDGELPCDPAAARSTATTADIGSPNDSGTVAPPPEARIDVALPLPWRLPSARKRAQEAGGGAKRLTAPRYGYHDPDIRTFVLHELPSFQDMDGDLGEQMRPASLENEGNSWLTRQDLCARQVRHHLSLHRRSEQVMRLLWLQGNVIQAMTRRNRNEVRSLEAWERKMKKLLKRGVIALLRGPNEEYGGFPRDSCGDEDLTTGMDAKVEEEMKNFYREHKWTKPERKAVLMLIQKYIGQVDALLAVRAKEEAESGYGGGGKGDGAWTDVVTVKVEQDTGDDEDNVLETIAPYREDEEEGQVQEAEGSDEQGQAANHMPWGASDCSNAEPAEIVKRARLL